MTHFTTSMVIIALLFFGGEALRSFSIALAVGMLICTYSSIYCAGSTAMYLKVTPADFPGPSTTCHEAGRGLELRVALRRSASYR
jgi:preprotein translocase subunit SecF